MRKKYLQVDNIGLLPESRGWLLVGVGRALHLAQVIQMAMREGSSEPARAYPEPLARHCPGCQWRLV